MFKPLLIAASLFVGILSATAQITITTADMPAPTKTIYMANDTLPTISVGSAGTSQTWNMAALVHHTIDTSSVVPYASAPNALFSSASFVVIQGPQNFYGYAVNSASGMSLIGGHAVINIQGTMTPINQTNTPAEILFNFPTSYNSTFNNNYVTNAKFYYGHTISGFMIDSIHQKQTIRKTVLADAWGTLTTPLAGGPYNVLRIKETKIIHDTTTVYAFGQWANVPGGAGFTADSTVTYSWWANGIGTAIATATMDSTGAVKTVQWLKSLPINTAGINEFSVGNNFSIYPNPAENQITIELTVPKTLGTAKEDVVINITNELGQLVKRENLKQITSGKNEMTYDVSDLRSGLYFIEIQNNNTSVTRKFIKQ